MKKYFESGGVTIYHGDCRELMPQLSDKSVEAVITDPPYSARTHAQAKTNKGKGHGVTAIEFEALNEADLDSILRECGRISRRWVVATLDYAHAFALDQNPPEGLRCLRIGVWVKTNPMPQISADRPGQGWESIAFLHRADTKPAWNGGGRAGVWIHPVIQNGGHPTTKPLKIVRDWVKLFTDPGDLILDPFMGSGTTLIAAQNEGRRAIGVEIDERYCELAAKQLKQESLFEPSIELIQDSLIDVNC